ncbi:MAG TPA: hypothetical protein VMI72_12400 [Roseiarcus sp.]|nr:hypothetical protein [Roseiarcus sp.]
MRSGLPAALATAFLALAAPPAVGAALCPGLAKVSPAPPELQTKIAETFEIPLDATHGAVVRCVGPKVMACVVGANLNCGRADTRRSLPGATAWCRSNPNSDFIPMYATGHATIFNWRCVDGKAAPGKTVVTVDRHGFFTESWREIR